MFKLNSMLASACLDFWSGWVFQIPAKAGCKHCVLSLSSIAVCTAGMMTSTVTSILREDRHLSTAHLAVGIWLKRPVEERRTVIAASYLAW